MPREIKFRAFDDGHMITMPLDTNFGISRFFGIIRDDAVIMQFTGLRDKHGKEIYENDIVRILYTDWCSKSENDAWTPLSSEGIKQSGIKEKIIKYLQ